MYGLIGSKQVQVGFKINCNKFPSGICSNQTAELMLLYVHETATEIGSEE